MTEDLELALGSRVGVDVREGGLNGIKIICVKFSNNQYNYFFDGLERWPCG